MFKKNSANLAPTSKIQFYSDPNKVNYITEIGGNNQDRRDFPPLLLNHGNVWVSVETGSSLY